MRQLLSFVLIAIWAAASAACRDSAASPVRPLLRGDLRVLLPARPSTLNPNLELDEVALVIGRNIFNQLLALNEAGRLIPDLAESWTTSADGLTYTFKLRQGVRWHDGTAFTAADVRATLATVAKERLAGQDALSHVQALETPDAYTVVIRLKQPWAPFAADLSGPGLSILPKHIYENRNWRTHPANDAPIGTGPFKFSRWTNENTLVLEANPNYFRSGPYIARLIFEVAPSDTVSRKLLNDEADYSVVRPAASELAKAAPEHLVTHRLPTSGRVYLAMNLRRPPFNDVRVRHALAGAVDRLDVIHKALAGLGAPAVGWYTPDVEWAYNTAARVPAFDPERSKRLMEAAGLRVKDGQRLRASFVVPDMPVMREVAALLRTQFAAIGVMADVVPVRTAEWPKRVLIAREFDLTLISGGQGPDPDQLRRRFLAGTDTGDFIGYDAPDFRAAVEHGARALDVGQRAAAYHRAQEVLARDVPFIPIAEAVKVVVHNQRVTGLPQVEARGLIGAFDFSLVKVNPRPATSPR